MTEKVIRTYLLTYTHTCIHTYMHTQESMGREDDRND
jgi:hypothetical protein